MSHASLVIVDYGVGNLNSLIRSVRQFTEAVVVSEEPEVIRAAAGIILPGVGAFAAGMRGLERRGLTSLIRELALSNRPLLGICLGAQLLLTEGHEFGIHSGLGVIPGKVVHFPPLPEKEKVPHIGWNSIRPPAPDAWTNTILAPVAPGTQVYFVHSYILEPADSVAVFALTTYGGYQFCAAIRRGNIYGTQFHPEKSGPVGQAIIKQFVALVKQQNEAVKIVITS
ncbi:MAG: imidazole glycerol phosphate synthase subunit HisH [Candidatus Magasanikbacteria bacterium]|nr:imidazole glycerol phosphate synthase subunit HisH [Candidatus Magasanikbacteria bacterium]